MIYLSPAKVNLTLRITGRDPKDGYHYIDSVFDPISLYDLIDIEPVPDKSITVIDKLGKLNIPQEKNIVYKAAKLMFDRFKLKGGLKITLYKVIPDGAGLGGGSANAATVLTVMNIIYKLKLPDKKLCGLGAKLGSDVPFFIYCKRARVTGKGEKITPVKKGGFNWYVLVCPKVKVPTKDAYTWLDREKKSSNLTFESPYNILTKKPDKALYNDFEKVVFKKHNVLRKIKQKLLMTKPVDAALSGSGATVYALYKTKALAVSAYEKVSRTCRNSFVCMAHTI